MRNTAQKRSSLKLCFFFRKYLPKPFSKTVQHLFKVFFHGLGRYLLKKNQGSVGEWFADHLWEIFPKIFVREMLGTFVPQCFLKMFSGMPPRRDFQNKCGVLGDISQNMCLPLGETSSERLLETNFSWKISPRGFSTKNLPNRFPLRNGLMPYYPVVS